jgi:hypothetical protein
MRDLDAGKPVVSRFVLLHCDDVVQAGASGNAARVKSTLLKKFVQNQLHEIACSMHSCGGNLSWG